MNNNKYKRQGTAFCCIFALGVLFGLTLGTAVFLFHSVSSTWTVKSAKHGGHAIPITLDASSRRSPHKLLHKVNSPPFPPPPEPPPQPWLASRPDPDLKGQMNQAALKATAEECASWTNAKAEANSVMHKLGKVRGNPNIWVYKGGDIVSTSIIAESQWESGSIAHALWALHELRILTNHSSLDPPLFLDVGSNLGVFAVSVAAQGAEWGQKVIAFEPMPQNLKLLGASICSNPSLIPRITLHRAGLGDKPDTCYIGAALTNVGNGFIFGCSNATALKITEAEEEARMERTIRSRGSAYRGKLVITTLNDVLAAERNRLMVMKMDTEGYEPRVLKGGSDVFSGEDPRVLFLLFELNTRQLRSTGHHALDLIRQLDDMGYLIALRGFNDWNVRYLNAKDKTQLRALETWGDEKWTVDMYATHRRYFKMKGEKAEQDMRSRIANKFDELPN